MNPLRLLCVLLVVVGTSVTSWTPALSAPALTPVGVWPLDPRPDVRHGFDPPSQRWGAGHRGVDLVGVVGQPVRTALAGTVTFAGPVAGKSVLVVEHGDTRTTYEPVVASVVVGARLRAGAVIGSLAGAPSHCVPTACLHWGWRRGEQYLDPLSMLGETPIRLLPPHEEAGRSPAVASRPATAERAGRALAGALAALAPPEVPHL